MLMGTDSVNANSSPCRSRVDFRIYCEEKIPLWKSWVSEGKVQEAIDQLVALERQSRTVGDNASTGRILVAIAEVCFEARNWLALNEQIVLQANRRSQPKGAVLKMVQESLTYIEKIPDKNDKLKLIETLSFITEDKSYLKTEKTILIKILAKIKKEERKRSKPANDIQEDVEVEPLIDSNKNKAKRRKPLCSQSKEILFNLNKYFKDLNDKDMSRTTPSNQLVSTSTGIPLSSVKRVVKEGNYLEKGKQFRSSKKTRKRTILVDDFQRALIRETIIESYCNGNGDIPHMNTLYEQLKSKINYTGSLTSLRTEVTLLGFKRKKIEGKTGILLEKHQIRFLRINFLTKMAEFRAQGRPIVYTGETNIDSSHLLKTPTSKENAQIIIIHAGGMSGYIPNALYIFEAIQNNSDNNRLSTRNANYMKWLKTQLIPNLKPNSVVVIDNAPYLNIFKNPAPSFNARKQEMLDWLTYRNIVHLKSMLKPQLYQLISQNKDSFNEYKIDSLLKEYNHAVLRLPPCHPKFNPLQGIWVKIKTAMARKKGSMSINSVMKIVKEQIHAITLQEWRNLCDVAINEEKKYADFEPAIDALTERFNLSDTSDEEESDDESHGESHDESQDESQ